MNHDRQSTKPFPLFVHSRNSRLVILILLFFCHIPGMSQEILQPAAIFESYQRSIVFVMQTLYFNPQLARYPKYIHEIEEVFETELLGAFVPIASGTGLIISQEGFCITNFHVINKEDLDITRKKVYRSILKAIDSSLHKFSFTRKQQERVEDDLWNLLENSKFSYQVQVNDRDNYEPEILESDEDLDIALLKISSKDPFVYAEFPAEYRPKMGESVIAIGYPLPDVLETLFKERQPSLTIGNISAIRDENWGLQHTAPINPGNSGGPLFNQYGKVIGINVAYIKDASNMFFAIPSNRVVEWLKNTSFTLSGEE